MKLKEKRREEGHFILYVPERVSSKAIANPSESFIETVEEIEGLDFISKSPKQFADICKKSFIKTKS